MVFNSISFFAFFTVVYLLYLIFPHKWQNRLLLVASYFFYGCWDWRFLSLIWISTALDYFCGIIIDRESDEKKRKLFVTLSVVANLGFLGVFKYFNFFYENMAVLLNRFGLHPGDLALRIILPVGISFYTFQTMSYAIDIYRRKMKPARNFLDFALFVAFFPQLVAGPIERASALLPQIVSPRKILPYDIRYGSWLIFWGLYKKVFIADNAAKIVNAIFASGHTPVSGLEVFVGSAAFAVQIFGDFSGYSDIARGTSKLFGIHLMVNFRYPYFVTNPRDFWRNWHISLSTWLRDYLYVPLGGNRGSNINLYRNLFLTMLLGGMWHGASWTFLIWGVYHGTILIAHRLIELRFGVAKEPKGILQTGWFLTKVIMMFMVTCGGWLIFRAQSVDQLTTMFRLLFSNPIGSFEEVRYILAAYMKPLLMTVWFFIIIHFMKFRNNDIEIVLKWPIPVRVVVYLIVFYSIVWYGVFGGNEFIYFQF